MSVWPKETQSLSLCDGEGALVSISIQVAPRHLESLLEALASIEFPINPQIYHEIAGGPVVEFPAYENHLSEVRHALLVSGFDEGCMRVTSMLEAIRAASAPQKL